MDARVPRVYIVGGGFGGLACAQALAGAKAQVILIDRRNHHVFQPLLYQVATAALSPADIATPIRGILRDQANCEVVLASLEGASLAERRLLFHDAAVEYGEEDYVVLAAGATPWYFGHDAAWSRTAPGLKSIEDAIDIRRRILLAFETAEYEGSVEDRRKDLTFAIVGGGPTGVELAGAIKEIASESLAGDFRFIDTKTTRVILLQGGDRILPEFPEELSARAQRDLEKMGVEVRVDARVTGITAEGVEIGGERLPVANVFWAAGVRANPLGETLGVPLGHAGRVVVGADLSVPGYRNVFVVGDMAEAKSADTGKVVPGVAQGGLQMGRFVGRLIARELGGEKERGAFVYRDKGSLATIGHSSAVAAIGKMKFGGIVAWFLWGVVHIAFLVGFRSRVRVLLGWFWNWLIWARDARLITGDARLHVRTPRDGVVLIPRRGEVETRRATEGHGERQGS